MKRSKLVNVTFINNDIEKNILFKNEIFETEYSTFQIFIEDLKDISDILRNNSHIDLKEIK